jgi:hypothetical protein
MSNRASVYENVISQHRGQ